LRKVLKLALCLILILLSGCKRLPEVPEKISFEGLKLVVWDVREPHFPGVRPFEDELVRATEEFKKKHNVTIELKLKNREDIKDLLLGKTKEQIPHLVYSTEWPMTSGFISDVSRNIGINELHDVAVSYWTKNGKLLGIPAYIYWLCPAKRGDAVSDTNLQDKVGYWIDAPGFFRAILDRAAGGWTEKNILHYVTWVKSTFGPFNEDPLDLWDRHSIDVLFPVTCHLFRWLEVSEQDEKVVVMPIPGPFDSSSFYYTVPAYLVLVKDEPYRSCATELGKNLARTRGRWAARAIGGIPAYTHDMPIFNLESGLSHEDRLKVIELLKSSSLQVPKAQDFAAKSNLHLELVNSIRDFLCGKAEMQKLDESIRQSLKDNNIN